MGELVYLTSRTQRPRPAADSVTSRRDAKVLLFTGVRQSRDARTKPKPGPAPRRQNR